MSVKKGEVYWFDMSRFTYLKPFETKILLKDRPYLVVSRNDWNDITGLCQVVPIQSNERFENSSHVILDEGKCIVTENITTVDQKLLGHFKETLSDEIMRKVDKAIIFQLNMEYIYEEVEIETTQKLLKDNDLDSYLNTNILSDISNKIEAIIKQKFLEQKKIFMKENVENFAIQLASNIEDLFSITDTDKNKIKNTEPKKDKNKVDKNNKKKNKNDKYALSDEEKEIKELLACTKVKRTETKKDLKPLDIPRRKNGTIIWDEKILKELIENSAKYNSQELCILYGFKSAHIAYQQVYIAKKKIKKLEK